MFIVGNLGLDHILILASVKPNSQGSIRPEYLWLRPISTQSIIEQSISKASKEVPGGRALTGRFDSVL